MLTRSALPLSAPRRGSARRAGGARRGGLPVAPAGGRDRVRRPAGREDGRGEFRRMDRLWKAGLLGAPEIFAHVEERRRRRLPVNDYARTTGTIQVWRDV